MYLIEIDPVRLQAAQAVVDGSRDPSPRIAPLILVGPHLVVELGGENDVVASSAQRGADDLFAFAERVDVGRVDEIDAAVERTMDDAFTRLMIGVAPCAQHHGTETEAAHVHAGLTQHAVFHR